MAGVADKNMKLNERLKDVYVTSTDESSEVQSRNKLDQKSLPIKRTTDFFELGYKESKKIPYGKVSLMQAMKFISDHRRNTKVWTVENIANQNNLPKDVASINIHT